MAEEMGGWKRKSEERCRKCSILTSVNAQGYCKKHWDERILEKAKAEEARETEEWLRHKEREREEAKTPEPPPTVEGRLANLDSRVTWLEKIVKSRWGLGGI